MRHSRHEHQRRCKIFLNGKELFGRDEYHHGAPFDAHIGKGTLKKGENVIVLKVCQTTRRSLGAGVALPDARLRRHRRPAAARTEDRRQRQYAKTIKLGFNPNAGHRTREEEASECAYVPSWPLLSHSALALTLSAAATGRSSADRTPPAFRPTRTCPPSGRRTRASSGRRAAGPRACRRPVVAGGKVYVTCSSGTRDDRLHVLCFDAATGKQLWHRQLQATGGTACHPKSCMAATTPVADETGVYALFATGDLAAFDADGTLRWYRSLVGDYPTITNQVGMASSPVLVKDRLIVPMDNAGESFLAAIDTKYGKNVWKADRPRDINWVTPLVRNVGDTTEVLFAGPGGLTSYDAATGEKRWSYKGGGGSIPTGVARRRHALPARRRRDRVKLNDKGAEEKPVWATKELQTGYSSPLVYRGKVFTASSQGLIACADAKTGKVLYKERVKGAFSASPVAGDGKVYCLNETGVCTVFKADSDTFEFLATNELGEETLGTPAIANGLIFIRTDKALYAIGK